MPVCIRCDCVVKKIYFTTLLHRILSLFPERWSGVPVVIQQVSKPKAIRVIDANDTLTPRPSISVDGFYFFMGEIMKKFILILICMNITLPCFGKFKIQDSNSCVIDTYGRNKYWFCGSTNKTKCGSTTFSRDNREARDMTHGEVVTDYRARGTHDHYNLLCCVVDGKGFFKYTTKSKAKPAELKNEYISENITIKTDEGGSCTYVKTVDTCGNIISDIPCTARDDCQSDEIVRNKKCVKPCTEPLVFFSPDVDTCVNCEETNYQGIAMDSQGHKYCKKCADNEIWLKTKKDCVKKETLTIVNKVDMQRCWQCKSVDSFRKCALGEDVTCGSSASTGTEKNKQTIPTPTLKRVETGPIQNLGKVIPF